MAVECFTGDVPFEAHSGLQAFVAHVQEEPPSLSARVPGLARGIDDVIARALAKQPGERYETCRELVDAAARALSVNARPETRLGVGHGRPAGPWPSMTRGRWIALAAVAVLLATAAAVGGVLLTKGDSGDDRGVATASAPPGAAPEPTPAATPPTPPAPRVEPAPGEPAPAEPTPAEPDLRIAPAVEPKPAPSAVDDAVLSTSFAGGIAIGDAPERLFEDVIFDVDFNRRGNEHPAVIAFLDGSDDSVSIPFDANYETPGDTLLLLSGDSELRSRAVVFEESDDGVLLASGLLTDEDTGEEIPFELRLGLHTGTSTFLLDRNRAILDGDLGSTTFRQVRHLIDNHPEVDTIVFASVLGSVDEAINVETGRLIREARYATVVATGGQVTSGGVDLFVAGAERSIEPGAQLGVHSWCCTASGKSAAELPRDHPDHASLLGYSREMLGEQKGTDFYFFTLEAAPPEGIHFMEPAEIARFGLTTEG